MYSGMWGIHGTATGSADHLYQVSQHSSLGVLRGSIWTYACKSNFKRALVEN